MKNITLALALLTTTLSAQSATFTASSLEYLGAFRLPGDDRNGEGFSFGGKFITLDGGDLLVSSRTAKLARLSIPSPVKAATIHELPFAVYKSDFIAPTAGNWSPDASMAGVLSIGGKTLTTQIIYYDANNTQRVGLFYEGQWRAIGHPLQQGLAAGYMAPVPHEWQAKLKGSVVFGQAEVPIITRTSAGPALFAATPAAVAQIPATPLVYYDSAHQTLGPWEGSSDVYGGTTAVTGVVLFDAAALFVGRNGMGPFCYGEGTALKALHNQVIDGLRYCFDPTSSDKGQHAYPYRYQVWAYDLNDFADVAAGTRDPWSLTPTVWELPLPFATVARKLGSAAYDPVTRTLYVSQTEADQDGYSYRALIHAFRVKGNTPTTTDPRVTLLEADVAALRQQVQGLTSKLQSVLNALLQAVKQ
jgi:hypothetical protein